MKFNKEIIDSDGGNFLRLKDGESAVGLLRGDIREFMAVFADSKTSEVPPGTSGSKFRFRVNLAQKIGEGFEMKVIEQGKKFYEQLSELNDEYPLESTVIKITRKGTGKNDTSYTIMPLLNAVLTPESRAKIDALPLHPLTPQIEGQAAPAKGPDELPF